LAITAESNTGKKKISRSFFVACTFLFDESF